MAAARGHPAPRTAGAQGGRQVPRAAERDEASSTALVQRSGLSAALLSGSEHRNTNTPEAPAKPALKAGKGLAGRQAGRQAPHLAVHDECVELVANLADLKQPRPRADVALPDLICRRRQAEEHRTGLRAARALSGRRLPQCAGMCSAPLLSAAPIPAARWCTLTPRPGASLWQGAAPHLAG